MKIRSKEEFIDLLDQELSWRKKELTFLKGNIKLNSPNYKTFLRSAILLLYAHWEGYIKNSCEYYLMFVKSQKLNYDELNENFIAICLKHRITDFEQTNKATIHNQLIDFILNKLSQRAIIPDENVINTGSNLNSAVLCEILTSIGLDYSDYELKNNLIDAILLKNRNSIAHGQFVELNDVEFNELHKEIIWMMDDIKTKLSNAAVLENYKTKKLQIP